MNGSRLLHAMLAPQKRQDASALDEAVASLKAHFSKVLAGDEITPAEIDAYKDAAVTVAKCSPAVGQLATAQLGAFLVQHEFERLRERLDQMLAGGNEP